MIYFFVCVCFCEGQLISSRHMRQYLHSERYPSEINESHKTCGKVQDAYSLRCTPQVHGIVYDTIAFAKHILETEMNSATDNPMVITSTGNDLFILPFLLSSNKSCLNQIAQ
jgi:histidine ammonia-lyase